MMPVEQQFQLTDRALPDFPHHLFVFHVSPQSRPITLCNTWELEKGYANSTPVPIRLQRVTSDFLRHAIDLRQNRRVANSWTVWTLWCNCGLVPVRAGF
jgi:hypothetical protein